MVGSKRWRGSGVSGWLDTTHMAGPGGMVFDVVLWRGKARVSNFRS